MTVLVTGASGHVGRPLVDALLKKGEEVRVLDRAPSPDTPKGVDVVLGDILDGGVVKEAASGADVIYHLAAVADYTAAPKSLMYEINVNGTKNVLANSKVGKLIYLSTTAVYGRNMWENPASERTPINPDSFYGTTKAMAEKLVIERGGVVVRSPVIYGPGFNQGLSVMVSGIGKGSMRVVGNGRNRIQWIHVSDLIRALLLAKKGRAGEVYLVSGDEARTQKELFAMLAAKLGVPPPKKGMPELVANALAHVPLVKSKVGGRKQKLFPEYIERISSDRRFDFSKARKELGFMPKMTYERGAREIVAEYLSKGQPDDRS